MSSVAALGFAPHSGWSVLVALGLDGSDARPRLLARERVELSGPEDPASKQPYHAVESLPVEEAARKLASCRADAERRAYDALARVLPTLAEEGRRIVGVGILESAGRRGASLEATLASHALIHTADGDHFRNAIAAAAVRHRAPRDAGSYPGSGGAGLGRRRPATRGPAGDASGSPPRGRPAVGSRPESRRPARLAGPEDRAVSVRELF